MSEVSREQLDRLAFEPGVSIVTVPPSALRGGPEDGAWQAAAHPRIDKRGRFATRPHLRRAKRAKQGHSTLRIGRGLVPFSAKTLKVRAINPLRVGSVMMSP